MSETNVEIKALKQQAWDLKKKEPGLGHAAALDRIARREGFPNWMRLLDAKKSK